MITNKNSGKLTAIVICTIATFLYLGLQSSSIYGGDGGDLVAAAIVKGIPHPPGYALYMFLAGFLVKIPFYTPAWRVGLMSSVASIFTLVTLFAILFKISNNILSSLIAVLSLAVVYLFWLYSIVPEVFALNSLFLSLLLYTFISWFQNGYKAKYLYLFFLILGLSLTHHHTIILILPVTIYFILRNKSKLSKKILLVCFLLFLIGLTPLLYLPLSAIADPPINWDNPQTLSSFIYLISRASYGTFKAGVFIGDTLFQRFLSIFVALQVMFEDFRLLGVALVLLGTHKLYQINKNIFWYLLLLFLTTIFFIFYASFPLVNDLMVGTFERFLLFPMLILTLFIGIGIENSALLLNNQLTKNQLFSHIPKRTRFIFIQLLFFILPIGLFLINLPKLSILKHDMTAENLASDIFASAEPQSIVLIASDTPLFSTQYLYYWKKAWPDIILIHSQRLWYPYYLKSLKKRYPSLIMPEEGSKNNINDFIIKNGSQFPIYLKEPTAESPGEWVPHGLLFKYYPKVAQIPDIDAVIMQNKELWDRYHDPLSGSLGKFNNLLVADVLRIYGIDHGVYGRFLMNNKRYEEAEEHLKKSVELFPSGYDIVTLLGQAYLKQEKCDLALSVFSLGYEKTKHSWIFPFYISKTYGECFKNEEKAKEFLEIYRELYQKIQTPLE